MMLARSRQQHVQVGLRWRRTTRPLLPEDLVRDRDRSDAKESGPGWPRACSSVSLTMLLSTQHDRARIGDQLDQRHHVVSRPGLGHQALARFSPDPCRRADDVRSPRRCWPRRWPDQPRRVTRSRALFSSNLVRRTTTSSRKSTKAVHHLAQAHECCGLTAVQGQHVDAETELCTEVKRKQLVQHHLGRGVPLQLDDHAQAVAVGSRRASRQCLRCVFRAPVRRSVRSGRPCSPGRAASVKLIASRSLRIVFDGRQVPRMMTEPRPLIRALRAPVRPMISPPVGKSGPGTMSSSSSRVTIRALST